MSRYISIAQSFRDVNYMIIASTISTVCPLNAYASQTVEEQYQVSSPSSHEAYSQNKSHSFSDYSVKNDRNISFNKEFNEFFEYLSKEQSSLDVVFSEVLFENLWDLYES